MAVDPEEKQKKLRLGIGDRLKAHKDSGKGGVLPVAHFLGSFDDVG